MGVGESGGRGGGGLGNEMEGGGRVERGGRGKREGDWEGELELKRGKRRVKWLCVYNRISSVSLSHTLRYRSSICLSIYPHISTYLHECHEKNVP